MLRISQSYRMQLYSGLGLIIILLLLISFSRIFFVNNFKGSEEGIKIRINQGDNLEEVISALNEAGILENTLTFKIAVKLSNKDESILPGKYIFKKPLNNSQIIQILTDPTFVQMINFRIPEGITIKKLSNMVESKLGISSKEFIIACSDSTLINELGLRGKVKTLEGFLFPDTYRISLNISSRDLIKLLVDNFKNKLNTSLETRPILNEPEKLLDIVTMASIIEAETYIKDEMPTIAGVYYNRIKKHMRLEADPTVQYSLPDGPKSRLLYEDLKIDSPYNTYRNFGLPPGPINSPGMDAIIAAVNPQKHDFLFFVTSGDGGHTFSENYEKHLEAVKQYRKKINQN
ncbi:MAG: endolytic transglycosylase MltG [Chlorobiota bacterium]|nr:MAG: endolytic transglycosylase MltG [Chlorobiota bacterium]MBV6399157.1 hypothetical protein [Ignavibacteria bacterium]MCE7953639.1 endolytic transglycosylase MltG [Chlorobi bacterium CHB7]RIK49176.1 MAG: endolytic transglycosylase MltG [Ignavibacteriota bacterium]